MNRVERFLKTVPSLDANALASGLRDLVSHERGDELEAFLIGDDRPARDELIPLDERELIAKIVERLRDEFAFATSHVDVAAIVVACTRPADSIFDRCGYDLAYVPRSE